MADVGRVHGGWTAVSPGGTANGGGDPDARRGHFLLDAYQILAARLAEGDALGGLARLAVSSLADLCVIDLLDTGSSRRTVVAHADPEIERRLQRSLHKWYPHPADDHPVAEVLRTGEPRRGTDLVAVLARATTAAADYSGVLRELGVRSYIALPLVAREHTLGTVLLTTVTTERTFGALDRLLAEDLARAASLAADTAQVVADKDASLARLALLAEATTVLTETLDPDAALSRLAHLVVPVLADWCGVHVMDESGIVRTVAMAHSDPAHVAAVEAANADIPLELASTSPVAAVLRTGEPRLFPAVTDELLARSASSAQQLDIFRALGIESAAAVPLRGRTRVLGALTLVSAESDRRLDESDLAVAVDLGRRAGLAVENAQLYRRASQVARAFEQVLVPERLSNVPGLDVAARYLPAAGTEVGGDWYDVIPLGDGRVGLVIGDVIGHDLRASSIMASLRTAVRSYAWTGSRPAVVVTCVDELARGLEADHMATLIYATYEPTTRRLCWSNAGHLPPLLVGPGPTATYLEHPSSVLVGAMGGVPYSEGDIELGPDSTVLFYTDGLVQDRGGLVSESLDRLAQFAAAQAGAHPGQLLNWALATMLGEDQRSDDIALLSVRVKD